ncbi:hypothetical protein GCM10007874_70660 [Labrys miyagiensis]|uniref:Uncharacterized protein n=1 Tax=Labrys miyagiensis TaxID=346912 RepID=A0ABQ6CWC8_9HYPH|nr:hypothetical protein [Labrys miyagiensis]GLS24045.1 hypothetical protein GCM10007874_70660 [Labrys miyagiensis]
MSKSIKALVVVGALAMGALFQGSAAMAGEFTVVNRNDNLAIQNVWFAHAGESDPWKAADVDAAIAPNSTSDFTISGNNCLFDIKVRFSDDYTSTYDNVNVCRGDRVIAN